MTDQSNVSLGCLIAACKRRCRQIKTAAGPRKHASTVLTNLENIMEIFELLLASKYGFAALASVTLAITMLTSTLGTLAYKAKRSGASTD